MKNNNASNQADIAELVTKHVNNLDDKGKLQLPEDMPDWQKAVIRSEKRTRDAQAELSKSQNTNRGLQAENGVLKQSAMSIVPDDFQLSDADLAEIDKLKTTDPEAYRLRVNALEKDAKEHQAKALDESTSKAREDAQTSHVAKSRVTILSEFREANPDLLISDDVLVNDVPPRFMKGVQDGDYTYGEYLEKVKTYVGTGKSASKKDEGDPHNIHKMNGSQTPGAKAAEKQGQGDYNNMTF